MKTFRYIVAMLMLIWGAAQAQPRFEEASFNDDPKAVQVFPNPAIDFVNIRFENPNAKSASVALHNIIGNEIAIEAEVLDDHHIHLKIKDLPTGYYLITVKQGESNSRSILKFLKR